MRFAVNSVDTGLDRINIYMFARQQSDMFNRPGAENKREKTQIYHNKCLQHTSKANSVN